MDDEPDIVGISESYCSLHSTDIYIVSGALNAVDCAKCVELIDVVPSNEACIVIIDNGRIAPLDAVRLLRAFTQKYAFRSVAVSQRGGVLATILATGFDRVIIGPCGQLGIPAYSCDIGQTTFERAARAASEYGSNLKAGGMDALLGKFLAGCFVERFGSEFIFESVRPLVGPIATMANYYVESGYEGMMWMTSPAVERKFFTSGARTNNFVSFGTRRLE